MHWHYYLLQFYYSLLQTIASQPDTQPTYNHKHTPLSRTRAILWSHIKSLNTEAYILNTEAYILNTEAYILNTEAYILTISVLDDLFLFFLQI